MAKLRNSAKKEEELVEVKAVEVKPEEVEVIAPLEVKPLQVELVEEQKTEPLVRVKLNSDIRTYIGDQWFNFKAGQLTTVPKQVKEILAKANLLDIL